MPSTSPNMEKPARGDWKSGVPSDTANLSKKGYLAVGATLGVFLVWALVFPLSGAVVADGKVIAAGQNKLLQHPSGGVVKRIVAADGDMLEKGELIAIIEPAAALAELAQLSARKEFLTAARYRLETLQAGRADDAKFRFTSSAALEMRGALGSSDNIDPNSLIREQQQVELEARSKLYKSELSALENQLFTLDGEFDAVERQLKNNKRRLTMLEDQQRKIAPLAAEGYVAKTTLWDIEANKLEASSRVHALKGNMESLAARMDEINDRMAVLKASKEQEDSRELSEILSELASIEKSIAAAEKLVEYSEIRAPTTGILTNLATHTVGGVVAAGATIAEVVPARQPLIVEARIQPTDIDTVTLKQPAKIMVTAFNARLEDPLDGKVAYVSADSQIDENTGASYFVTRIAVAPGNPSAARLKSGMDAQVFIQTEGRNFISYIMRPITDSFRKAFRER